MRGVNLLPPALEQALVGRVLHERVLERVGRLRRNAASIDELGLDEMLQCPLELAPRSEPMTAASSRCSKTRPMQAPIWAASLTKRAGRGEPSANPVASMEWPAGARGRPGHNDRRRRSGAQTRERSWSAPRRTGARLRSWPGSGSRPPAGRGLPPATRSMIASLWSRPRRLSEAR